MSVLRFSLSESAGSRPARSEYPQTAEDFVELDADESTQRVRNTAPMERVSASQCLLFLTRFHIFISCSSSFLSEVSRSASMQACVVIVFQATRKVH